MSEEKSGLNVNVPDSQWKLFVGIDFGTDGSGISYTLPNGKSYIHNMWNSNDANVKSKTSVLLTKDNEVDSVGDNAEELWFKAESPKKLFKTFKMNLYDDTHKTKIKKSDENFKFVDLKNEISASNDPTIVVSSELIFVSELIYLKNNAFEFIMTHLKDKYQLIGNDKDGFSNVQYFLTVPGIYLCGYIHIIFFVYIENI